MPTISICPRNWSEQPIKAALEAIQKAFPTATVDHERGQERALAILERLRELNAPESIQAPYVHGASHAAMITLPAITADSIEFMIMPGEGIQLSGPSVNSLLAEEFARALDYEYEEIG